MDTTTKRTSSTNADFVALVEELDAELAIRDGEDHDFYHQFNGIDSLRWVLVCYHEGNPVACGAIKELAPNKVEVKRMYTRMGHRGKGYASEVLNALERWGAELGYQKALLETGINQPEAIGLYIKQGYKLISNYGQYAGVETSRCFEKNLR